MTPSCLGSLEKVSFFGGYFFLKSIFGTLEMSNTCKNFQNLKSVGHPPFSPKFFYQNDWPEISFCQQVVRYCFYTVYTVLLCDKDDNRMTGEEQKTAGERADTIPFVTVTLYILHSCKARFCCHLLLFSISFV